MKDSEEVAADAIAKRPEEQVRRVYTVECPPSREAQAAIASNTDVIRPMAAAIAKVYADDRHDIDIENWFDMKLSQYPPLTNQRADQ